MEAPGLESSAGRLRTEPGGPFTIWSPSAWSDSKLGVQQSHPKNFLPRLPTTDPALGRDALHLMK